MINIEKLILSEVQAFLESDQQYDIFVDMDGVLVNFDKQLKLKTGILDFEDYAKKHSRQEVWDKIHALGISFWSEMEWMPGGKQLWNYIKKFNPTILSAPSEEKVSKLGKIKWIHNNLGDMPYLLVPAKEKQKYASKNSILIDDYDRNIKQWRDKGGIGILHKNWADTLKQLKQLGI